MNKWTDSERLLEDVLTGESGESARVASLENILLLSRQRRRVRAVRRVVVVAALVIASTIGVMRHFAPKTVRPEIAKTNPPAASLAWVTSQPLLSTELVTSQPLLPGQIVSSLHAPSIVHTVPEIIREVGDDELLALAAPQVVALVRRGPHEAELVFLTPQAALDAN